MIKASSILTSVPSLNLSVTSWWSSYLFRLPPISAGTFQKQLDSTLVITHAHLWTRQETLRCREKWIIIDGWVSREKDYHWRYRLVQAQRSRFLVQLYCIGSLPQEFGQTIAITLLRFSSSSASDVPTTFPLCQLMIWVMSPRSFNSRLHDWWNPCLGPSAWLQIQINSSYFEGVKMLETCLQIHTGYAKWPQGPDSVSYS